MSDIKPVTVNIMGNEYHVSSPEDQIFQLEKAAKELDQRMREIKESGRIVGIERIAVMAALNMTYELQQNGSSSPKNSSVITSRIKKMQKQIDSTLASNAQMELT